MEAKKLSKIQLSCYAHYVGIGIGLRSHQIKELFQHIAAQDAEIKATEQERHAIGVRLATIKDLEKEIKRLEAENRGLRDYRESADFNFNRYHAINDLLDEILKSKAGEGVPVELLSKIHKVREKRYENRQNPIL